MLKGQYNFYTINEGIRVACIGIRYVVEYAQSASHTHSCQSLFDLSTIFFNKLPRVLLNASMRPLVGALYIDELCCLKLNLSQRLFINLL